MTRQRRAWCFGTFGILLIAAAMVVFLPGSGSSHSVGIDCGSALHAARSSADDYQTRYTQKLIDDAQSGTGPRIVDPRALDWAKRAGSDCHSGGVTRLVIAGVLFAGAVAAVLSLGYKREAAP